MDILIIENDVSTAQQAKAYLELSNFNVVIETDGLKGGKMAMSGEYDMIILGINLPGQSGFEICSKFRASYEDNPIILLASKEDELDYIHTFSLEADDYILKPFRPYVLVARAGRHLRRYKKWTSSQPLHAEPKRNLITCGSLQIDGISHRVFVGGEEKKLTSKEFSLLFHLASHPNQVFSKEELFRHVWGFTPGGDTSTLVVHIRKIREKIETDTANPEFIQTVWGTGYRFRAIN